jgi:carbamoyl-phosphate synthase large subunit
MVIGSGPIVIGQAAEFDYAGTQACRALREEGLQVVLINSNPATIMTDRSMADRIYIEPLTLETVRRVIEIERPDSLLSTLGGQTGLTLSMQLAKEGFLDRMNVRLLGACPETIEKAEDRQCFKDTMEKIGQPCIPSKVVTDLDGALGFADTIGYPVIVRPAYTLGGTGGGIAADPDDLRVIGERGLRSSPIGQILVERSVSGWKEIEFEVIRDKKGNGITVCSMENVDPVGVHTGDSVVVAPAVTLSDKEYQMLRTASLRIIDEMGIEGGCNCQFALNPDSFEYAVIEVNPRVSRSSALASKATGYPIAKVATKIAVGYHLDEIINEVTGCTYACFEPSIDYIVVKFPRWPFDKFVYGEKKLGTQMKATGEVMSIGVSFEQAIMKAAQSVELKLDSMRSSALAKESDDIIRKRVQTCDDMRLFAVYEAIYRGIEHPEEIFRITRIDRWFLYKFSNLAVMQHKLEEGRLTKELYMRAKKFGYLDDTIKKLSGCSTERFAQPAAYKMVDTCAAEFPAETPYFYSTYDDENEAAAFLHRKDTGKRRVLVLGSGPIRIGQGIEFDYCSVHCVWALKKFGYEAVILNNNPETVSTDFDTADRLYFDPLTPESVDNLLATEKPWGVVVQFGGQTAIRLTKHLQKRGVKILGTPADSIDAAEDRERFDKILAKCGILRPQGRTVMTAEEALDVGATLGYPVLLRPSYVLGGQNMIIAQTSDQVQEYMDIIVRAGLENPVLIDKYMMGTEVEVDAICDGETLLIPGIMEHVERAGVHSGDSISVYPPRTLSERVKETVVRYTGLLAKELGVIGMVNVQYVVVADRVYCIEVNPRSSRTVPFISKVTGVPMVELATRAMLGERLAEMGYGCGLYPQAPVYAVKVPVFSFEKLSGVDVHLGPEMKSTGEVLGIAATFEEALYKGMTAAGAKMPRDKGVLMTVKDSDKTELIPIAEQFEKLGFTLYGTAGTALMLNRHMVATNSVRKIQEPSPNAKDLIESGKISYVISTSKGGANPVAHPSVRLRRMAVERGVTCLTSLDTAKALAVVLAMGKTMTDIELTCINDL